MSDKDYNQLAAEAWARAVGSWEPPKIKKDFYLRIIHEVLDAGIVPVPSQEVVDAFTDLRRVASEKELNAEEIIEWNIHNKKKPEGWMFKENHERSMPIQVFIEDQFARPSSKFKQGLWLLPVFDDQEYISWNFVFVPQDVTKVLADIKWLKEQILEANP